MATGEFEFVHNLRVPGMLHGAVVRPPTVGATLVSIDERSVGDMPGVVRVVAKNNFVGVVAEKPWQAMQAAAKLRVDWTKGTSLPAQRELYDYLRSRPARRDSVLVDSGDVDARLKSAARVIKATYHYPYQMHGSLGSSCAVADVGDGKATLWSATQAVYPMRSTAAMLLGLPPEQVRVIFRTGFGLLRSQRRRHGDIRRRAPFAGRRAARARAALAGRRDGLGELRHGVCHRSARRAGRRRRIVAWDYEAWNPTRGSRPGTGRPGNVVTGFLAGFEPAPFAPRATERAAAFANRSNAAPSYVTGCVGGRCEGTGSISSERVLSHAVESPFWTGPLRSPSRLQNTLAHECFMDEVAASVKADPIAYRLRHLRDPRMREVLEKAARTANWDARPSPAPGRRPTGIARGRGVSCVLYEGDNGYCAMVAEVEVNQDTGDVAVTRCIVALDCGPVSNPDGARNQIEGGVIQGISRTLREEVTWDERVTSVNWTTYRPWYLGDAVPIIESVFVDRHDVEACGAGETSITVTAAAIGNAIFDATGARLREIPFTSQRVKKALTVAG